MDGDVERVGRVVIGRFDEVLDGHGGGTALAVAQEVDVVMQRCAIDGFEPFLDGEIHICDMESRLHHDEVGVYLINRDAVAEVVGDDESVTLFDEDTFEREAVRRCFGIGSDGVVADEDESFGSPVLRQDDFAGEGDIVPVTIEAGVGPDDLDGGVLVAIFEYLLHDSRSCDTTGAAWSVGAMGRFGCFGIFGDRRAVG